MNKILWMVYGSDGLSIGFRTIADLDEFLDSQSGNPAWKRQFTVTREYPYDEETWILHITQPVSFRNPNQPCN